MSNPTIPGTMTNEELARRLGKGRQAMITAARTFCRTAVPITGKLTELEVGLLIGAAVEIAKTGKRVDYMIALFARLTGGQVSVATAAEPVDLRQADNDISAPSGPIVLTAHNETPRLGMSCPHGVPLAELCPTCDKETG